MKNITNIRKKYEKIFAEKYCNIDDISLCKKQICTCSKAAEVYAYIESVIPEEFHKCTINDFNGKNKNNERILDIDIATSIKKQIIRYCWDIKLEDFDIISKDVYKLGKISILHKRRENGNNVIIYGSSGVYGRSLIASIIMKEVIKQRLRHGNYIETYDWVEFSILKENIIKDNEDAANSRSSDWLVVDNIDETIFATDKQSSFVVSKIDPFFGYRFKNKMPTIFIFRFDIRKSYFIQRIEKLLGFSVLNIVKSNRTFHIPLNKK